MRISYFNLLPRQWKLMATGASNMGQGVILFSLAAIFVPGTLGLPGEFPKLAAVAFLIVGILIFLLGVILMRRGNN